MLLKKEGNKILRILPGLEEVVVKLREDVPNLKAFFSEISMRLNHLKGDVKEMRGDIRELSLLKWTVGLILGMWVTVMITLIPSS